MKFTLALLVSLLFVATSQADDDLLVEMGLSDLKVVKDTEASQVMGKGFVIAYGLSSNAFELGVIGSAFESAIAEATQNLELVGLNQVEGITGATNEISFDLSQATSEVDSFMIQGNMTISSSTVVAGFAN